MSVLQQSHRISQDLTKRTDQPASLDFDDIQHFLMSRPPARAARYEFLSFRSGVGGRAWLTGLIDKVGTAGAVGSSLLDARWVTVGFTWNGLQTLGVAEASLANFPEEFRQGMAARAGVLGTTGANHPDHWVGGLASPNLHAIVVLFARDVAERERCRGEHERYVAQCGGVEVLSSLDLEAIPPFDYAHEHFGYRDRLSQPVIEGTGMEPTPGSGPPIKPGEFFLGYPDEEGPAAALPQPEILSRNGSYVAYLRMQEHVGAFRDFLRAHGETPEQAKMDPHGYGCPLGAHIRRMNPRDTAANMNRRKMIRRGGTYGPPLPEGVPDDGIERGIAAFVGCASLVRQFEFAMNVWTNDPNFHELGNERDPIFGTQDGTFDMTIPKRPIRKKIIGLPAFTTIRGGAYFFLPGIKALRYLGSLSDGV